MNTNPRGITSRTVNKFWRTRLLPSFLPVLYHTRLCVSGSAKNSNVAVDQGFVWNIKRCVRQMITATLEDLHRRWGDSMKETEDTNKYRRVLDYFTNDDDSVAFNTGSGKFDLESANFVICLQSRGTSSKDYMIYFCLQDWVFPLRLSVT